MDMANQGFLGIQTVPSRRIEDFLAHASLQQAWRTAASRSMLDDLRAGLQRDAAPLLSTDRPVEPDPAVFSPFSGAGRTASEWFLAGPGRYKSGGRRLQILSGFVELLGARSDERITTAMLARHLHLSEAALYRHFDSRASMLENLIGIIEIGFFESVKKATAECAKLAAESTQIASQLIVLFMRFAELNPGIARTMTGDVLAVEDDFLRRRMALFFERFQAEIAAILRGHAPDANGVEKNDEVDDVASIAAANATSFCVGRLSRYSTSGFKHSPTAKIHESLALLLRSSNT